MCHQEGHLYMHMLMKQRLMRKNIKVLYGDNNGGKYYKN